MKFAVKNQRKFDDNDCMNLRGALTEMSGGTRISDVERNDPRVQAALRQTLTNSLRFSMVLAPGTSLLFAFILWWKGGVGAWSAGLWCSGAIICVIANYPTYFGEADRSTPRWMRRMLGSQVLGGIVWGSLPVVAMPAVEEWRPFVGVAMLSLLAACAVFGAPIRSAFWSFVIPLSLLVIPAFIVQGGPLGVAFAAIFAYSIPFSGVLCRIGGTSHETAAAFAVKNDHLVASLSEEQERLRGANGLLEHRATHDPLTNVLNRAGCMAELDDALEASAVQTTTTGLLFLDLDNFKSVNDSMGHDAGDQLLMALTSRVSGALPETAVLARLGGDELTIILREIDSVDEAVALAKRVTGLFAQSFDIRGRPLSMSASIGIAVAESGDTALDLLRYADTALYRAKDQGRNRYEVFDSALRKSLQATIDEEYELREAVRAGHIEAFVQPFVCLETGCLLGGEALARWMHPSGVRNAGQFIEVAERTNLLAELSLAVLEQIGDARVRSAALAMCSISVNVSPEALTQVMGVVDAQANYLDGLFLEITENGTVEDLEVARQLLDEAQMSGAKILFDDLGVGEAPLSLLTELPLDGIKIDCDFVWKIETSVAARSVVEAIVKVAEGMGLWVIAEGVETESQAAMLYEMGVPVAQGYLFAPALPISEFEQLVSGHKVWPTPWNTAAIAAA